MITGKLKEAILNFISGVFVTDKPRVSYHISQVTRTGTGVAEPVFIEFAKNCPDASFAQQPLSSRQDFRFVSFDIDLHQINPVDAQARCLVV